MLDGKDFDEDEFIRSNADDIFLLEQGEFETLHELQMQRNKIDIDQDGELGIDSELPF